MKKTLRQVEAEIRDEWGALYRAVSARVAPVPVDEMPEDWCTPEISLASAMRQSIARDMRGEPSPEWCSAEATERRGKEIAALEVKFLLDCVGPLLRELDRDQARRGKPRKKRAGKARKALGAAVRRAIIARDKGRCRYCGGSGDATRGPDGFSWHIDHRHPVSRGGGDDPTNLVLACRRCNLRKNAKLPEVFPLLDGQLG